MANIEFMLYDQNGNQKTTLFPASADIARAEMMIGEGEIVLPGWDLYKTIRPEYRIGIFRSIDNASPKLLGNTYWIITKITRRRKSRIKYLVLSLKDLNVILFRHIIPYAAGNAGSTKSEAADNLVKEIVRENFLSGTRSIASVFSVDSDTTKCPVVSLAFDYKNVLDTLQNVANASYQSGTYLSFDVVPDATNKFSFVTYTGQRGKDRRYTNSNSPVIIDSELNLGDFEITDDYAEMATLIYARGQGEQVYSASDSTRLFSAIGAREVLLSAGNANTPAQIQTEANLGLKKYRPKKIFVGDFIESPSMQFEKDIYFGDYCTVQIDTDRLDVRVNAFHWGFADGKEKIKLSLRSDV